MTSSYGLTPDPWQQSVLDDWLRESGGKWASLTCGLSVPRQNGKNGALEVREIFGMVGLGERILHTAHQVKTAQKHFRRLKQFFGKKANDPAAQYPELNALVSEIRNVNGQEAIFLLNGGSLELVARSTGSGRGFTVDVIVCDEAQDMSDDDQEALLSTSSSAPLGNPQWIYTGTPPGPKVNGEVFTRVRAAALADRPGRRCWHEWSAEPGTDLDDRETWVTVNPGLVTGRLLFDVVEGERGEMSDEGFARERLGMWSDAGVSRVIPADAWSDAADTSSVPVDAFALGVEVGPDMGWASLSLAGLRADGGWHVELQEHRQGVDWVVPTVTAYVGLNPQVRAVVADAGSPVAGLFDDFERARVRLTMPKVRELGSACQAFLAGVVTGQVRHIGQPQVNVAAGVAGKRPLGDTGMWVWSRKSAAADITPIQAATLALWGAQSLTVKRPGRRTGQGRRVVTTC